MRSPFTQSLNRRNSLLILFCLTIAITAMIINEANRREATQIQAFAGAPINQSNAAPHRWVRALPNSGFSLGYSEWRKSAVWAQWQLVSLDHAGQKRPKHFRPDKRLWRHRNNGEFRDSGYDRGHLAPNYAMNRAHGRQAQLDSFLISNIAAQRPNLNRLLWQRIEELETDFWLPKSEALWLTVGPIFDADEQQLAGGAEIADAFFRILLAETNNGLEVLAFITPQEVTGFEKLWMFTATVDEVEQKTQLDFFSDLEDSLEAELEARPVSDFWQLQKVGHRRPRYAN